LVVPVGPAARPVAHDRRPDLVGRAPLRRRLLRGRSAEASVCRRRASGARRRYFLRAFRPRAHPRRHEQEGGRSAGATTPARGCDRAHRSCWLVRHRSDVLSDELGQATAVVVNILLFASLVWVTAVSMNRSDRERSAGERRLATQYATTYILAQAGSLSEAMPQILEAIGKSLD